MKAASVILHAHDAPGGWRASVSSRTGPTHIEVPGGEQRESRLSEALRAAGVTPGARAILTLGTSACLCATISTIDLPSRQRRQAMLYRLEEKLPLAAEDVVADFIEAGNSALGIAVQRHHLAELLASCAAAGARITAIVPASLLALQQQDLGGAVDQIILSPADAGQRELFAFKDARLVDWFNCLDETQDIETALAMAKLRTPGVTQVRRLEIIPPADPAAVRTPWVNLAENAVEIGLKTASRWSTFAALAAILFIACWAGALFWRSAQYGAVAARLETQQQSLFLETFPGQAVPYDVRSRLQSEARQIDQRPPASSSGLIVLRDLLANLPSDVRFRVTGVRLDDGAFTIEGESRSHSDAEAIAATLRRRKGFNVASPRTEQRAGRGISFTISGNVVSTAQPSPRDLEQKASR